MTPLVAEAPGKRLRAAWVRLVREPLSTEERAALRGARYRIAGPQDVVGLLRPRCEQALEESFYVVALDSQSHVLAVVELSRGILNSSLVHPREVLGLL